MGLPLEGVRVLDLGVVLAGPQAALLLGDLGAEVIRVESTQHFPPQTRGVFAHPTKESIMASIPSAGGYPMREAGERPWNRFPWFNTTARNKKSMTIDLKKPRGRELFLRLATLSDVLVSNQTPGALDGLGLSYEELARVNPRIIYIQGSSFGSSGPYASYKALGLQMEAYAGHDLLRRYPDRDVSANTWAVTADSSGALTMAIAAQMALYSRVKTGRGQYVDVSMVENFIGLLGHAVLDFTMNGNVPDTLGNRDYAAIQGCYPCEGDDRWLVLTLGDDAAWSAFRRAADDPEGCDRPEFATSSGRYAHHEEIDRIITAWTSRLNREDAVERLRREGVMAGPVLDDADAMADPHLAARGYFVDVWQQDTGTHRYPGFPYKFHNTPLEVRLPPVMLGEHNEYVYKTLLGVSDADYAELEAEGHIGTEYAPHIR